MDSKKFLIVWIAVFAILGTERFGLFPNFIDSDGWAYKSLIFIVAYVGLLLTFISVKNELPKGMAKNSIGVLFWVMIGFALIFVGYALNGNGWEQFKSVMAEYTDGITFYALSMSLLIMVIGNKTNEKRHLIK